jgi:ferric-dicitrate binding protein FerR (iron transport regulator)
MEVSKKLDELLADEKFQDDLLKLGREFSKEERNIFLNKYSITEKEFIEAWKLLSGMSFIQERSDPAEVSYALKKLQKRIDLSVPVKERQISIITLISRVAAFLSIPLLLSTLYFYQQTRNSAMILSVEEQVLNTFQAPAGAKSQVTLPDGSQVWLNSESILSCPAHFDAGIREVKLTGEAYFEVVKNEKAPMVISAGDLKVKVYGTRFNVNAFPDRGVIETTLVEGKVTVIPGEEKQEYSLEPGYVASYALQKGTLQIMKVEKIDAFTGWKDGKLLFYNEQFADILQKLERWYNVDIQLKDPSLGNYTLYATFFDENIEQVLDIFSKSIPIAVTYPQRIKQSDGSYAKREILIARSK